MANKRIATAELDFDAIKSNLKSYLQGQETFSDYNFEGSGLSVLLDVLAYNTHYNALYNNLAVNEMFLDSASKRSSVVSLANNLGYTPRSATAPTATVNVVVSNTSSTPTTLTIPKYTAFTTTLSGETYNFYTTSEEQAILSGSTYTFSNVDLKEGQFLSFRYTVSSGQRYIIPNAGADLSTLTVRVQDNSGSSTYVTYTEATEFVQLTSTDKVYFVKEIENELYEIEFGDGTLGVALDNGNVVTLQYLVTNKDATNGASTFTYAGDSLLGGTVATTTVSAASGGTDLETIESIRYNAPLHYSTQDRGVTVDDYRSLINEYVSNVEAVNVWGGEDNDPPVYGKVFVSIKPTDADTLTAVQKNNVETQVLKPKNVVSVIPELVDPEFINVEVSTAAYYNPRLTSRTANDLKTLVTSTIETYNTTDLEKFDSIFRISKLSRLIDATEAGIVSNITTVVLNKVLSPTFNVASQYTFNLGNPIYSEGVAEDSVLSTAFFIAGDATNEYYIDDDGVGNLRLFYFTSAGVRTYTNNSVGTVNYTTGVVTVPSLNITALGTNETVFKFTIKPSSYDVVASRNQIVRILDNQITVTMIQDQIALGNAAGGTNHTFTTSRS